MAKPKVNDATGLREKLGVITQEELFALFRVAPGTGKNRQSVGSLPPHYKVGRTKLYRVAEVDE